LQVTGKGLAKAGLRMTKFSIKPELSKNHFRFFKITKNKKTKWFFAAKNAETLNARELQPRFCQTHVICRFFLVEFCV